MKSLFLKAKIYPQSQIGIWHSKFNLGFTLIELMVALIIIEIVALFSVRILTSESFMSTKSKQRILATQLAQNEIENGNFAEAINLFEKIADLCIDLGDDVLGKEFFNKATKIKGMLEKAGTPLKVAEPPKVAETPKKPEQDKITTPPKPPIPQETLEAPKPPEPSKMTAPPKPPTASKIADETSQELTAIPKKPDITPIPQKPAEITEEKPEIVINPEDFMIKQTPKQVVSVPKNAKAKLKTSAYGHVTNPTKTDESPREALTPTSFFKPETETPEVPSSPPPFTPDSQKAPETNIPPAPKMSEKPAPPVPRTTEEPLKPENELASLPEKPAQQEAKPSSTPELKAIDKAQIANVEKTLTDLKIKKANISKMSLDLEMKELMGEISKEDYDEKMKKLKAFEDQINAQIADLEKML